MKEPLSRRSQQLNFFVTFLWRLGQRGLRQSMES